MLNLRSSRIDRPGRRFRGRGLPSALLRVAILQVVILQVPILSMGPAVAVRAADESSSVPGPLLAQAELPDDNPPTRALEPRYQPREPEEKSWYDGSYIFALSRGLADSTIAPAGKAPLFLFTVPLDIAFLPFAIIGGLFG